MKNNKLRNKFPKKPLSYLTSLILFTSSHVYGDVGKLLWEDNFNNLNPDAWHVDIGDGCDQGLCGWGNQELQWYGESNTYIADVPGESGNKALVLEARDEASNGYVFTSGKVESSNKVAVQYGMIEVRMQVPDVGIGLWPAAWMLGTTTQSWPAKGEIDMMEMGHKASGRAEAGHPDADINSYVGSNLIFYTDAACSSGNPTCAASTAWQTDNAHVSTSPLTNRFVTYRTYWTETSIRFTVEDNGVEVDMYDSPFNISEESNEFQAPFYLLLNLAVGGNFTDAATNNQVTAAKPAKMYIDYVRIYELDGQGEVFIGSQTVAEAGTFGIFTDNTPTNNKLVAGQSSDIYVWNQNSVTEGSLSADEGDNVIAWNYTSSNEWFGGGIQSRQVRDLSNFNDNGELSFRIKIPADVSFKIGIADTYTNQNWVEFPANTTAYGLVRNGDWATATIPAADIRGNLVALQSLEGMFNIASVDGQLPTGPFEMAIDDIVWTGGGDVIITDSDGDGVDDILDNCANTPVGATVDANGCEVVVIVDTDNDSIIDDNDLCPNTATGVAVDSTGCAIIVAQSRLIQAEDYTNFSDTTANNIGGQYRNDAVDIEVTTDTDGGFNVGWIESGETLDYTLELGAGSYDISTRVASQTNGRYTLTLDGQPFGSDSVATGGWQVFQSHNLGNITLTSGEHSLRITSGSGNFNINWINLALIDTRPIDADNDGVLDDVDQCLGTAAGAVVDDNGCEVIVPFDADNDGVLDDVDQCLGTAAGVTVDGTGCEVVALEKLGVTGSSATNVEFFVNLNGWADVHYILNGAGQQNFRMTNNGSKNTRILSGLSTGDAIEYSFTYQDDDGSVKRSSWSTYAFNGQSEQDSDNDGVIDSLDQCANTPANMVVNEIGCAVVEEIFGISTTSADSAEFFVNVNGWADVHYILNGAGQKNFRMTQTNSDNYKGLNGLIQGDVIEYSFTYQDDDGSVKKSEWSTYTFAEMMVGDSDNDGINDDIDACPSTANGVAVDAVGCPIDNSGTDTDGDGVADVQDQCPGTSAGAPVNALGCEVSTDVLEVTSANEILVGGAGSTNPGHSLYVFDNDLSANGSNCNDDCAATWPPALVTDGVATGVGSLGTVTRNDGSLQATYNGRPLYFYANDTAAGQTSGHGVGNVWWAVEYGTGNIVPLFSANTSLEQAISFDRGDALVTRFADRGRDRHAKEDHFQVYDHYLSHYWTHRTAQFEFVDYVAKGGSSIEVTFITEWKLGAREFRAWYRGLGTVAEYHGNYFGGGTVVELDNGRYDDNFNKISDIGDQYRYRVIVDDYRPLNWSASDGSLPLSIGQRMEIEVSQFLDAVPEGRNNYYGTTYLYIVGQGLVPWKTVGDFTDPSSEREDSYPIAAKGWLGGNTTLPYNYTAEPDNHFMQMATNLSNINGQPFVQGRRVHHTDFETGQHDERIANGVFDELAGKAGTHYVNTSCSNCHERNGRASVADIGLSLDKWVFKVAAANGQADPQIGSVLQPNNVGIDPTLGEGTVSIASWTESNGLRSPNYSFSKGTPALFSARLAPQLVGLGLLEAISETTILEREDASDANGDGISGKAQRSTDPVTGETRLGRFGYKAGASSVKHQVAGALNTDMGVMTSVKPTPDCGSAQTTCGNTTGSELSDKHLDNLVKYIALLGVRPQRDLDDANVILGETKFNQAGCESCHRDNMQTSEFSQLSELRNQTIRPFTDLLLHDMGAGLADNLGEGEATGAEWRTTPLWGLGLSACVTGGVTNPTGHQGDEVCTPDASYLHDGRARTIEEAILWHGGEGENSRIAYENLSASDKSALLSFLKSL